MVATRVLVVDDNEHHASGLAELLQQAGFDAQFVNTGCDALRIANEESVDAILLDLGLPDMSGYEVCKRLRSNAKTANIAVVFHTGTQEGYYADHQGDAFLTYPIAFSELFSVIQGCVARRHRVKANSNIQTDIDERRTASFRYGRV
jgi:DNA-binding response OmpR family regulator